MNRRCAVCDREYDGSGNMCAACCRSYDRTASEDGSVFAAIRWAANRARHHERKRAALATLAKIASESK